MAKHKKTAGKKRVKRAAKRVMIVLRLDPAIAAELSRMAADLDISRNSLAVRLLRSSVLVGKAMEKGGGSGLFESLGLGELLESAATKALEEARKLGKASV